jgi:hypothetical protein
MVTKAEAKRFVYKLTADSLRRKARIVTSGDLGGKATQKDVAKVKEQMIALAQKLNPRESNELEARTPGPNEGQDHLSKVDDAAREGEPRAAARDDEPKAGRR